MAKVTYNKDQVKKASWPLPPNDKISSKIPSKSLDFKGNRYYYQRKEKDVNKRDYIMSVTTWLNCLSKGIGFNRWLGNALSYESAMSYANERAFIGTMTHALCMYLIWGDEVDTSHGFYDVDDSIIKPVPDEVKMRLSGFIDFVDDHKPIPIATEISLYNNLKDDEKDMVYPYAGTADQLMMIDGKLWLVDIKTGAEYPKEHQLQLTAYKLLFDSLYGEITGSIDILACLYLKGNGKYKVRKYKFKPGIWTHLVSMGFYSFSDMRDNMPKVKEREALPTIYTLKEEENKDGSEETNT